MFLLILRRILVFQKSDPEILAIGKVITGEPVKCSIFFHKIKGPGKLWIRFHMLKFYVLHEWVCWQNFPKVYCY